MKKYITSAAAAALAVIAGATLLVQGRTVHADCAALPSHEQLKKALIEARNQDNGGLALDMWGTLVDRSGIVCAVAYSGEGEGSQWPGSRVISAQKANAANAFSLKGLALSTANLFGPTQPGESLFELVNSNPVATDVAYAGEAKDFGTTKDPLVSKRMGGVNVFGGGLALYDDKGEILGGLGVSGDTSCADHNIAWLTRHGLNLDFVPKGVSPQGDDQIIFDLKDGKSAGGFGHAACGPKVAEFSGKLPAVRKVEAAK